VGTYENVKKHMEIFGLKGKGKLYN
jgi:hypothetical protein